VVVLVLVTCELLLLYLAFVLRSVGRVISDDDLLCHVYIDRWSVRRVAAGTAKEILHFFSLFSFPRASDPFSGSLTLYPKEI